jgi:hypothetical protein
MQALVASDLPDALLEPRRLGQAPPALEAASDLHPRRV